MESSILITVINVLERISNIVLRKTAASRTSVTDQIGDFSLFSLFYDAQIFSLMTLPYRLNTSTLVGSACTVLTRNDFQLNCFDKSAHKTIKIIMITFIYKDHR